MSSSSLGHSTIIHGVRSRPSPLYCIPGSCGISPSCPDALCRDRASFGHHRWFHACLPPLQSYPASCHHQLVPSPRSFTMDATCNLPGTCLFIDSPPSQYLTSHAQITANGGFFMTNLFSFLSPASMTLQTPPELKAYGWTTADIWCAPATTAFYALLTHAQPFWAELHTVVAQSLGSVSPDEPVKPLDPEYARAICASLLASLFVGRAVKNFGLWKKQFSLNAGALGHYLVSIHPLTSITEPQKKAPKQKTQ